MADEKSVSEKLDSIFDSISKRMDKADEERKADRAKLDAACGRMDAADEEKKADKVRKDAEDEKARKDAAEKEEKEKEEKVKADAARKDAEEKEEKAKADAARADAAARATANPELAARLAAIEHHIGGMPEDQRAQFVDTQVKAERVAQAFGDSAGAPRWVAGESLTQYRRRLLTKFKSHSQQWKDVDLTPFADKALDTVETQIYADAMQVATRPPTVAGAPLNMRVKIDETGRQIRTFHGDPESCWAPFKQPARIVSAWQQTKVQ